MSNRIHATLPRIHATLPLRKQITAPVFAALVIIFHMTYLIIPLALTIYPMITFYTWCRGAADHPSASAPFVLTIFFAYFSTWILFKSHTRTGYPVNFLNTNPLLRFVLSSIPVSILATEKMPESTSSNLIFACHPHGALAFNRAAVGFEVESLWLKATGIKNLRVLTATAAFYVPLIREMWLWSYCIEASKRVAVGALRNLNPNQKVQERVGLFVYPGGMDEQLLTEQGKEIIYLKERKGFIKLALEQGLDVVPV